MPNQANSADAKSRAADLYVLCQEKDHKIRIAKKRIVITFAMLMSFLGLIILFLGPMFLFRKYYGIPLDAQGPKGEIWFLIIGGGFGCGFGYLIFYYILKKIGNFDESEINKLWNGRK